jgi:LPXTG-motif cell wall-anchored protein
MVVTYTAVVNDDADFTSTGNKNEVVFDYSNDPNHDYNGDEPGTDEPMGETPKDETTTYLTNIEITKISNGDTSAALAGAEFEITSSDYNVTLVTGEKFESSTYVVKTDEGETEIAGPWYKLKDGSYTTTAPTSTTGTSYESTSVTYKKVTFTKSNTTPGTTNKVTVISGEDGKIKLEGLKPGTYTIKETKAPSGYNLDSTEHVIKIDWDPTNKKMVLDTNTSDSKAAFVDNTATATITIDNESGATLPSTGGIGTTIFYMTGAILAIGAGVLMVARRRMNAN